MAVSLSEFEAVALYENYAAALEDPLTRDAALSASQGANPSFVDQLLLDSGIVDPPIDLDVPEFLDATRRLGLVEVYEIPLIFDMDVFVDANHWAQTARTHAYDSMVGGTTSSTIPGSTAQVGVFAQLRAHVTQQRQLAQPIDLVYVQQLVQSSFSPSVSVFDGVEVRTLAGHVVLQCRLSSTRRACCG